MTAVTAVAVLAVLGGLVALVASAGIRAAREPRDGRGSFAVSCAWSHTSADDPIAAPGRPGASHLHAFFGSTETDADATRGELVRGGTTCTDPRDTAAVWAPVASVDGAAVTPARERTYYFGSGGRADPADLPPDLRMIAGGPGAMPDGRPIVTWSCGRDTPVATRPYDCGTFREPTSETDGLVARVDFPSCWDGTSLDAPDHRSHVVYPTNDGCPADHPEVIPRLSIRIHTAVWDPCAGVRPCGPDDPSENLRLTLSSGSFETLHVDFWNAWHQERLDRLTDACLRAGKKCGIIGTPREADDIFDGATAPGA